MKIILNLFILVLVLALPSSSYSHSIGQPPYFKVNGIFTDYYPVPTTSLTDFVLPEDNASGIFIVNEQINFEIDTEALPLPDQIIKETKFIWDFGDGEIGEGLSNKHTYNKPGTYFVAIKADSGQGFEPQSLQSTAINILPDKNYVLPKAIIEINGKRSEDPLLDIVDVNFSKSINFDASKTEKGTAEINEYLWDLGDQNFRTGISFNYLYKEDPYTVFPVLRVKTVDGFISDAFIQIKDEAAFNESITDNLWSMDWRNVTLAIATSALLAGIITWLISKYLSKANK
jgi:hypothetical protein